MPFNIQTKTAMFIQCGRICCLCLKQCGTNMEAAHIIDEAEGGSNEADNGIPVCLDCHQEIGAYNPSHPKGNKFRPVELKARRDRLYGLVETGALYAQIIAQQTRLAQIDTAIPSLDINKVQRKPSSEATRFLKMLLSPTQSVDAPARKLSLLNEQDRAHILDKLLYVAAENPKAIEIIARIVQSPAFQNSQTLLLLEQLVRGITLYGDVHAKAELLRTIPEDILGEVYEGLRLALFEDLIAIVKGNQYDEVNEIVPALANHMSDIPMELNKSYGLALLGQANSDSFRGAPAAQRALANLPKEIAKEVLAALDIKYLSWNARKKPIRRFVEQYIGLAIPKHRKVLDDFTKLSPRDFDLKYLPDDDD